MLRKFLLSLSLSFCLSAPVLAAEKVTVFAAASLTDAMTAIGKDYEEATGIEAVFSFAGSGTLARQVEAGAPADVFISADEAWMNYAVEKQAVDPGSVQVIAENELVLVGPKGVDKLELTADALTARLSGGRLAIADPDTVPAGRYGKQSLEGTGLWDSVSGKLAPMENVRVALASVARGDTPLGIVYASDAHVEPKVEVLAVFPRESHTPIRYPAALTVGASEGTADFLDFLSSETARKRLEEAGLTPAD
ncbi:molybdate ABC transporter substrate-binding protein [Roseibium litorale]|uniref:Molybdate ABC transporter substrate-binding protein n=1 Tax=Roseibium litorale TaxID=2803841 RepID=A0ABR9CKU3_9HYPH|nr:molybdate ABC transporter substrate-binding protein [Roseibium litorale]MBD8891470.1 molybdate ABC transporter substrate-binding protein [Roseibium litorale]